MAPFALLHLITLFFGGILAGMEIAVHYGLGSSPAVLSDESQLRLRQAMTLRLRVLVPAAFLPAALTAIATAILEGASSGLWLRLAGLLALLVWIATRLIATVHINSATLDWNPEAPPSNWKSLVARAERFHVLGVWAATAAFVCYLAAFALLPTAARGA